MSIYSENPVNIAFCTIQEVPLVVEPSHSHKIIDTSKRLIGRTALILGLAASLGSATGISEAVLEPPTPAHAATFTNGYPDIDATDCSAIYGIYSWCKGDPSKWLSPRKYGYRNCTDGAEFWAETYTGVKLSGWGDANNWDKAAPAASVYAGTTNSIEPGDIAQSDDGSLGHVGFITSVIKNADGTVTSFTTAELNKAGDGNYTGPDVNVYNTRNTVGNFSRGGTNDWDHFIDLNGPSKGLNNETLTSGDGSSIARGTTTVSSYDPATAMFYLTNAVQPGNAEATPVYGNAEWVPLAGDWDGDGKDSLGAYDPASATFYLRNSTIPGNADVIVQYGNVGWMPLMGDWDGNGTDTLGSYNPATATFYLRNSLTPGNAEGTYVYGNVGWLPLAGDWDGNGKDTLGAYDPATATFYLTNAGVPSFAEGTPVYGNVGWAPLVGDWDGDGRDGLGSYNPATATFYLRNATTAGNADRSFEYGRVGWLPLAGNWDGR